MNNEILELANSLSDDVKQLLLVDEGGKQSINGANLSKALNIANLNDVQTILKIYLRLLCEPRGQWENVRWNKIQPIENRLLKLFDEIGIKESENPFIEFISHLLSNNSMNLSDNHLVDLINLYAKDEISYEDLVGKGDYGPNHIIFNENLYSIDDIYKTVQIWNWLSNPQNLKKMNWEEVLDSHLSNNIDRAASQMLQMSDQIGDDEASYYRDAIMFRDGTSNSVLNSINTLEEVLRRGSMNSGEVATTSKVSNGTQPTTFRKDLLRTLSNYDDLSDSEIAQTIRDVLKGLHISL